MAENPLRQLPSVHQVLSDPAVTNVILRFGHDAVADVTRIILDRRREQIRKENPTDSFMLVEALTKELEQREAPKLQPVINATGVLLHTNLGRAPMAHTAVKAVAMAAGGYLNLELDLETGKRTKRQDVVRGWLCRLLNSESATVVNNCAAATVIVLRSLAIGKEVIVSRGQLVEIGGSFRIPEIMAVSGATLREVGTTNITRSSDYEQAIGTQTALLMRIHQSNYRVLGFTEMPSIGDLVSLGRKHNLPVVDDIGSGALIDYSQFGLPGEPLAADSLKAGADLVLFSGDKLLGGSQAGIIAGRKDLIEKIERDPLMRAFRLDKLALAALEATLRLFLRPEIALTDVPVLRQLNTPIDELRRRARRIVKKIPGASIRDDETFVGGGSLPDQSYPTVVVALKPTDSDEALARRLRLGNPAVLARVQNGDVLLDLRSVLPEQLNDLINALGLAIQSEPAA